MSVEPEKHCVYNSVGFILLHPYVARHAPHPAPPPPSALCCCSAAGSCIIYKLASFSFCRLNASRPVFLPVVITCLKVICNNCLFSDSRVVEVTLIFASFRLFKSLKLKRFETDFFSLCSRCFAFKTFSAPLKHLIDFLMKIAVVMWNHLYPHRDIFIFTPLLSGNAAGRAAENVAPGKCVCVGGGLTS